MGSNKKLSMVDPQYILVQTDQQGMRDWHDMSYN